MYVYNVYLTFFNVLFTSATFLFIVLSITKQFTSVLMLYLYLCVVWHKVGTNRDGTISYLEFLEKYHQRGGTPDGLRMLGSLQK